MTAARKATIPIRAEPHRVEQISHPTTDTVPTPFLVVELDTAEANTAAMQGRLEDSGIAIRPHIKVHRIPDLGRMQTSAGAAGIACQTLEEVERMIDAGFGDILLTNSLVDPRKLDRFMELNARAAVAITAESEEAVRELSRVARSWGRKARLYVECDIGGARTGFAEPEPAAALATTIAGSSHLEFGGLAAYLGGNPECPDIKAGDTMLSQVVSELDRAGINVPTVSVGGTVFAMRAWPHCPPGTVTEARPGNYSFYDATKVDFGLVTYSECALRVSSTVVSRPNPNRVVLDVGWRILSNNENPRRSTYGHILEYPQARINRLYTEHAVVELPEAADSPGIGERITIVPNSCDGVLASVETLYGVRGGRIEQVWRLWERALLN